MRAPVHLDLGETDEVLALFDGPIYGSRSHVVLDMVDASSLLWQLFLRGIDVGDRWNDLARNWEPVAAAGNYAFNALFTREVGHPAAQAIRAFGDGDYAATARLLRPIRNIAHRFGGSHAQRDVLDLTLIEAAFRSGQKALAAALAAERIEAEPASPLARLFVNRARTMVTA